MKIAVFSAQPYDREFLSSTNTRLFSTHNFTLSYHPVALSASTTALAASHPAILAFVNDTLSAPVLSTLHAHGTRAILLRCAGHNNIDLAAAAALGLFVANVPAYAPEAVAEFALALLMTLRRQTHRAFNRVREGNFALSGLVGSTLHGKTVGVVGTGRIGVAFARIVRGLGCRVVGYDVFHAAAFEALGGEYVGMEALLAAADVVSLHCPLVDGTRHLINEATLGLMKEGAMLVNTSRGGLVDTAAVIAALKSRRLGALAMDVYELEEGLFFQDHSGEIMEDEVLARLMTFPNVLVTGHQGFLTREALAEIAEVTFRNLECFVEGKECANRLFAQEST